MEVLINSKSDVSHEMEIIVSAEELKPHFDKAYREESKNIAMPGFRRGKVPLQIIKRKFGEAIEYQAVEKLSNEFFRQSIEERHIQPINQPVLEEMKYEPGGDLTIRVGYETMPELKAKDYLGISLERLVHETTGVEVEEELETIRKQRRKLEPVEKADEEGYVVTFDIQVLDEDGNPVAGKKSEGIVIDIDDESLHADLRAELLNLKSGEEADIEIRFEREDGSEGIDKAHIALKKVEKEQLPELDDEFAKTISNDAVETAAAFMPWLKERIREHWENRYQRMIEEDLIRKVVERNKVEIPNSIIDNVLDDYVKQLKEAQPNRKLPESFDEKKYREERRSQAEFTANWMFVRESIVEQEGIKLDDADVEQKAEMEASRLGIDKEKLIQFYKQSDQFAQSLITEKLMNVLLSAATINEIGDDDVSNTAFESLQHDHDHDHDGNHDHDHSHSHDHDHDHDDHKH